MIILKLYKPEDLEHLNYVLDETQRSFTSSAELALQKIDERSDNLAFPVTVYHENTPVGFFVLDFGNDKMELTDNPKSVLVRSLSINPSFQGKGIGTEAMMQIPDFLKTHFDEKKTTEIVLAVNFKNTSAYQLYLKAGYEDNGNTRPWKDGFQYLLSLKLGN